MSQQYSKVAVNVIKAGEFEVSSNNQEYTLLCLIQSYKCNLVAHRFTANINLSFDNVPL